MPGAPAMVERLSTTPLACPVAVPDSTDSAR